MPIFFLLKPKTSTAPKTRFTSQPESKSIIPFLTRLQDKEGELKKPADKDPASVDAQKYALIKNLNETLRGVITNFNEQKILSNVQQERDAFIERLLNFSVERSNLSSVN